jgi:hypothetical protein
LNGIRTKGSGSPPSSGDAGWIQKTNLQISEFPAGDFGSNRQAISVETDRPFRSKVAPGSERVSVPASANRRC